MCWSHGGAQAGADAQQPATECRRHPLPLPCTAAAGPPQPRRRPTLLADGQAGTHGGSLAADGVQGTLEGNRQGRAGCKAPTCAVAAGTRPTRMCRELTHPRSARPDYSRQGAATGGDCCAASADCRQHWRHARSLDSVRSGHETCQSAGTRGYSQCPACCPDKCPTAAASLVSSGQPNDGGKGHQVRSWPSCAFRSVLRSDMDIPGACRRPRVAVGQADLLCKSKAAADSYPTKQTSHCY